ncbi:hypothetical protein [Yoonia sp. 208BN28-4]|uniref:hypothetical protein n=1 Tax=Yoonia sp. 208BN28-4 TaxID=3126505 RepID=UPI0030AB91CE
MKMILAAAALIASPFAAQAQTVSDCDWRASTHAVVEPWEEHTALFANGAVRLAYLDTVEPAVGAAHILILSPPYDELGIRQCKVVSLTENTGFAGVFWPSLSAGYDPARGLLFDMNVAVYDPATSNAPTVGLALTLNQSTGEITAALQAPLE